MREISGVCLDIAGVLVDSGRLLPGAAEALAALDAAGLPWRLLTNTSRRPQADILAELRALGLAVADDQLLSAPRVLAELVRARGLNPMLLVHPAIRDKFPPADPGRPFDAVVVCDAAEGFSYAALDAAFGVLAGGAPLLAVGLNRCFRDGARLALDAGPFVRALEYAAGVSAEIVGKPGQAMFARALAGLGLPASAVVMIGDDAEADVAGAMAAGLGGVLVRTGKYRAGDEDRLPPGAGCADDLLSALRLAGVAL